MPDTLSAKKSRIAVLMHSMNAGGAQKRLVSLANGFATRGHAVDLVAMSGRGEVGRLVAPEVRQIVLETSGGISAPRVVAGLGALKAYLRRESPAVLMAGSNRAHIVAALACAAVPRPPLLVLRAARHPIRQLPWSRPWKRVREYGLRPIERWALNRADLVIAVSRESAAAIVALVADPAKVVAIPNPTITPQFRAGLTRRVEHPWFDADAGGEPVILGVGRITQQKDFWTLVEALSLVLRTRPAKLIILGEGGSRPSVEALIAQRGLGDRVQLMGHVDGVGGWLARADLLVSSSLWEGSPGAIIEAFEAGLPVVATSCPGGSVELLEGSAGGLLVPMRDPAAMGAAILAMLDRPRDREALRALAQPYQDDGRAEGQYLDAIEAVLARKTATPDRAPPRSP